MHSQNIEHLRRFCPELAGLVQYAGRIHRQLEGKDKVTIYDYVDVSLPTLQRMYQRRSKGYEAMAYTEVSQNGEMDTQAQLGLH